MNESTNLKSSSIAEDRPLADFMTKECANVHVKNYEYLTSELEQKELKDSKMKFKSTDSEAECTSPDQESCDEEALKELDFAGNIDNQRSHVESLRNESRNELSNQVTDLKCESMSLYPTLEYPNCEQGKELCVLDSAKDQNIGESSKNVTTEYKSVEQVSAKEAQSSKNVQSTEDGSKSLIQSCPQIPPNLDKLPCSVTPSSYPRALLPYLPPPGLGNMGNSCYINAVMQCLAVCFQDSSILEEIERRGTEVGGLAYWFFKVINEINNTGSNISLVDLKREMGKISSKYASYGQQDAFELLMFIFKNVEGELKSIGLTIMPEIFSFEVATVLTPACHHEQTSLQREYAIILSPSIKSNQELGNEIFLNMFQFQFRLISWWRTFRGLLGMIQVIYVILKNKFWETKTTPELKLEELLEGFFRKEDNYEIFCPTCQEGEELSKGTLEYQLKSPPKILIIYINRYNALKSNKMDENIEVKLNDFKVKCSEGLATYSAIAYCEHSGTLQSGHYTAHVRVFPGCPWYKCNDSFVATSKQQSDSVRSRAVYMVFYKKKKTQNSDLALTE